MNWIEKITYWYDNCPQDKSDYLRKPVFYLPVNIKAIDELEQRLNSCLPS